jgi:hypothetical protein
MDNRLMRTRCRGPVHLYEKAPAWTPEAVPPTRPDFPASTPGAASPHTQYHHDNSFRAQVTQDYCSARAATHTAPI